MEVKTADLKELRERTGVSLSECKAALIESEGDIEKAIEVLRKRGIAKAAKKGDRVAHEGTIQAVIDGKRGALVQLYCETDFVARNEEFVNLAKAIGALALGEGVEESAPAADALIKAAVLKLGENIQLGAVKVLEGEVVDAYIHHNSKFGTLIAGEGVSVEVLHDIAMHAAQTCPECVLPEEISPELIASERDIWAAQLTNEGKPEAMHENILKGKEKKFRAEKALTTQEFIKDPSKSIQDLLGGGKITAFVRLAI